MHSHYLGDPINQDTSSITGLAEEYDFLIIGGGTAGLVVASRLTEDPDVKVLVIEAGQNRGNDPRITIPGLALSTYSDLEYDWNFVSTPQGSLDGRCVAQPRGKCLGGSSAINLSVMAYPSKLDVDNWAKLGNAGWSWECMVPYYRKFHTFTPPSTSIQNHLALGYMDSSRQGMSGPIKCSFTEEQSVLNTAWLETFRALNLEMTGDPLSGLANGGQVNSSTIDPETKTRSYAVSAYYTSEVAKRTNLRILTEAHVEKVMFENAKHIAIATGVQFRARNSVSRTIKAKLEVILAAGTLQSPQLLELSGIGSEDLLKSHGIDVVKGNKYVGENLQDHVVGCLGFEIEDTVPSADDFRDPRLAEGAMALYQTKRSGPLSGNNVSTAFTPTCGCLDSKDRAELHAKLIKHLDFPAQSWHQGYVEQSLLMRTMLETGDDSSAQFFSFTAQLNTIHNADLQKLFEPSTPGRYMTILAALSHPFSRGSVHINSADPTQKPTIDPNYLSHPLDKDLLGHHIQFLETIARTQPLASLIKKDGRRIPAGLHVDNIDAAKEHTKLSISNFHLVGTCAMMPERLGGVVDEQLVVYGTKNLRVVDGSIIPLIPRGNIQSSVYAVAEKAADLVKRDLEKNRGRNRKNGFQRNARCLIS